jgi:hypothetical protein
MLCCFLMVASLCALGLQSAVWYVSLDLANTVYSLQCQDVYVEGYDSYGSNPRCNCKRDIHFVDVDEGSMEYETCMYEE